MTNAAPRTPYLDLRRAAAAGLCAFAALIFAAPAQAASNAAPASFDLNFCTSQGASGSTTGWSHLLSGGATASDFTLVADCTNAPLNGLFVGSSSSSRTVHTGAQAAWSFAAPAGTTITHVAWKGAVHAARGKAGDWQTGVAWAGGGTICNTATTPLGCHLTGGSRSVSSGWVQIFARCASGPCDTRAVNGSASRAARASITSVSLTIEDPTPPRGGVTGQLWTSAWQRGARTLSYAAYDPSGIKTVALFIGGQSSVAWTTKQVCSYTAPAPCPTSVSGSWSVDTRLLPDGAHDAQVFAYDAAGNVGHAGAITLHTDNTPPPRAESVVVPQGSNWSQVNSFGLQWRDPVEDLATQAPIAAASWCLTPAAHPDPAHCTLARPLAGYGLSNAAGIRVPDDGQWNAYVTLYDLAGNTSRDTTDPVVMRFDDQAPSPTVFEPIDVQDPAQVRVRVSDNASGVNAGQIELERIGSTSWRELPTSISDGHLVARIDDASLPRGVYRLRALAQDAAGNQAVGSQRVGGQAASIPIPVRLTTRSRLGFVRTARVRRHGRTRVVTRLRHSLTVAYHHALRVRGRLATSDGQALSGRQLVVYARARMLGAARTVVGVVSTDRNGRFDYRAQARMSRDLTFAFPGNKVLLPIAGTLRLGVRASSSINAMPRSPVNDHQATFTGRLRGGLIPPGGKSLTLEYYLPHRGWRLFGSAIRTDATGRWRLPYFFQGISRSTRIRIRVSVPAEADYPFAQGYSRVLSVTVHGG